MSPGGDQFMADVGGRAGIPGSGGDAGGFGKDLITAIGHFSQLSYRRGEVTLLGGISDCGAVQGAVQKRVNS
jgi:hypothetical protein